METTLDRGREAAGERGQEGGGFRVVRFGLEPDAPYTVDGWIDTGDERWEELVAREVDA